MSLKNNRLMVVIPAYHCANHITAVVESIPDYIDHIIVVDDVSPDSLPQTVKKIQKANLTYIRHSENQGVGGAMLTGYNEAINRGADIIIKIDGDGQMDAHHIPQLIGPISNGQADYTKGNRFLHLKQLTQMPRQRLIGNFGLTFMTKAASGYWQIFDPNNGFTAIHQNCIQLIDQRNIHRRYFFESSVLIELNRIRAVVMDVPMPAQYGEEKSSLSLTRAFFEFPYNLLKGLFRRIVWQYFLYDFTAVSLFLLCGLPLLIGGTVWGAYHWYISIRDNQIATTGTVMLAVLPIIMGFQLLLQAVVLDIQNVPTESIQQQEKVNQKF